MNMARWKKRVTGLLVHPIMIVAASFGLFPFLWALSSSFKGQRELYTTLPALFPHYFTLENYRFVLAGAGANQLLNLYRNSIFVTINSVVLTVIIVSLAGYALARLRFWGRDAIFGLFIVLMFLPAAGTLMAQYELMHKLHLRNSLIGLILLYSGGGGINLFLMRQVFLGIPAELEDAARIDGASDLRICFQIMMPLATSGMVLVAIMQFIAIWGEYIVCLTMIDTADKLTLSAGLGSILFTSPALGEISSYGVTATSVLLTAMPVVLVFIFLQRWFIKGAVEGLKI
ncbi:MAG: hypothetical protein CVU38_03045 [Chloroflexi bacterium HGW-Chloroflexi-1]|nr:MAG: hypothetical protein CVU38_03045 [Chloroflexi bacterium HGW-Chloroflexi-1]